MTQQSQFVKMQYQEPPLQGTQQIQFQKVQQVDTWKHRQQQQNTIRAQFQKIHQQKDLPPIYVDKTTKQICLFHGTTIDQFPLFTERQKTILPKFYLTFDLSEAIRYAHDRAKKTHVPPGLLVFKIRDQTLLTKLEISNTHIVLKKQTDIRLFLKNTIVEMITIKPPRQQSTKSSTST